MLKINIFLIYGMHIWGEIKNEIDLENIKNIDKKYFWHYAQIHTNNYKNKVYLVVIFGLNVKNWYFSYLWFVDMKMRN